MSGFAHHLSATYCAHLVLISNFLFPQCAFQLPASIWLHMLVPPVGLSTTSLVLFKYLNFSCAPVPPSNFLHAFDFNISASPVSQQLLWLIWFQYLTSPLCLSSNFLNFLHSLGFNIYTSPVAFPITSCVHFVLISKLPPRCPSTTSCIHLASIFPVPLNNFLHSFGFISGSTVAS